MTDIQPGMKRPLWTKNYILILVSNFFTFMIHFALFTNLPSYMKSIGGDNTLAGLTTTIYTLSALAVRPFWGLLIDKLGRRTVVIMGMAISLCAAILFFFSDTTIMVLAVRVINGIGFSALGTVTGTLVADNVPPERLSEGIGYSGISLTVSTAVGPAMGAGLIKLFGFKALFVYVIATVVVSFICSMMLKYKPVPKNDGAAKMSFMGAVFERSSLKPALVVIVLAVSYGSVATFMASFGVDRNLNGVSLFFIIYAFVALAARIGTGRLADTHGVNTVFWPGLIALFLSYISLAFTYGMPMLVVAGIFYGFGYGISFPMMNVMVMKECPEHKRGAASAMLFSGMDIGIGVGAFIWGMVSQNAGFTAMYLSSAVVVILASVLYYLLLHHDSKLRVE